MTNTATPTRNRWDTHRFAIISVGALCTKADTATPTYMTTGHDVADCPKATGFAVGRDESLADAYEAAEYWDGEVCYMTPWPCSTCVNVASSGRTVAFEALRSFPQGEGHSTPTTIDPGTAEAVEYARTYTGSFGFMLDMRAKALGAFRPTPNMVTAILRCKSADARKANVAAEAPQTPVAAPVDAETARRSSLAPNAYAGTCKACGTDVAASAGKREKVGGSWVVWHATTTECNVKPAAVQASTTPTLADVPEGHYAITSTGANDLAFYRVDRPVDGPWAGRTFVKMVIRRQARHAGSPPERPRHPRPHRGRGDRIQRSPVRSGVGPVLTVQPPPHRRVEPKPGHRPRLPHEGGMNVLTFPQRRALGELSRATVARSPRSIFTRRDVLWRLGESGYVVRTSSDLWRITPAGQKAYDEAMERLFDYGK